MNNAIASILIGAAEVLRPPRRLSVSEAAQQYMRISRPGGASDYWSARKTPYMVEPMDRLMDRSVEAVIFVGPARTGKSAGLLLGWLTFAVCCDPGDMLIVHMTADTARDFSRDDIARLHRHSPEMKKRLSPYLRDDNVFDKQYRHGMILKLGWPSITQLSGKTLRYVAITDYDRLPDTIDGEGNAFTLARKRTQTFLSGGRILAESSPGRLIIDPKWQPLNPHEGPPCGGIFALYNQGDRRRWYWPCPHCGAYFTAPPSPEAFTLHEGHAALVCPVHGCVIEAHHKPLLNQRGVWRADGQTIDANGGVSGDPPVSTVASYWLTGPAAAYQTWDSLYRKYQAALNEMETTGNEESMQGVITGDYGTAYRPRKLQVERDGRLLQERAEAHSKRTVPDGVWFLTAAIDVQGHRFVIQVVGWGHGGERWLIDRYNLRWSQRLGGNGEPEPIDPTGYAEDWHILIESVVQKRYPLASDRTRGLKPVMVAIDSAGQANHKVSVTERAYTFWRWARAGGHARSLMLIKGSSRKDGARISKTFPDSSQRSNRKANARGEIPVWQLNTLLLKDSLAADLERTEPGPGYLHFPDWLGAWFYDELTAETRTTKGWENLSRSRNEAFDLMVYNTAAWLALRGDQLHPDRLPAWADPRQSAMAMASPDAPPARLASSSAPPKAPTRHGDSWGL
ncbi:MAG: phage terminase large subunit family protein [Gammaproteobacteria bacterium]|nr:phage terminase large subunit family protein [Gammaproteobacteria bacterium]